MYVLKITHGKTNMGHTLFLITITIHVVTFHFYIYPSSTMVNKRVSSPMPERTSDSGDADALVEIRVVIDELCRHN